MRWVALLLVGCGGSSVSDKPACSEMANIQSEAQCVAELVAACPEAKRPEDCEAWERVTAECDRRMREWVRCR